MTTAPKLEDRAAQRYVGIRARVPMDQLPNFIGPSLQKLFGWLNARGIAPAGPPLLRFWVIDMACNLEVEAGVPVAAEIEGEGEIAPGILPSGRYASLIYTGVENGIAGNKVLIDWAQESGVEWDRRDDPNGDAFGCRVEFFLSGPADDPDPAKWDTLVAIRLAESQQPK